MISKSAFGMSKNGLPWKNKCLCRTPELIENYDKAIADDNQIWECHHRNGRCKTNNHRDFCVAYISDTPGVFEPLLNSTEQLKAFDFW